MPRGDGRWDYVGQRFVVTSSACCNTYNTISTRTVTAFSATLSLRAERGQGKSVGVGVLVSLERLPQDGFADGDICFGRLDDRVVVMRLEAGRWHDLYETTRPSRADQFQRFEITRTGAEYEFRLGGVEVARWRAPGSRRDWLHLFTTGGNRGEYEQFSVRGH
jgi:hypothetical protein